MYMQLTESFNPLKSKLKMKILPLENQTISIHKLFNTEQSYPFVKAPQCLIKMWEESLAHQLMDECPHIGVVSTTKALSVPGTLIMVM